MIKVIIFAVMLICTVLLQIFLSKRQNKWLGLLLPLICLMFSLLAVMNVAALGSYSAEASLSYRAEDGSWVEQSGEQIATSPTTSDTLATLGTVAVVFLLYNIPTAILLVIYAACREQIRKNTQMEKMSIQDL